MFPQSQHHQATMSDKGVWTGIESWRICLFITLGSARLESRLDRWLSQTLKAVSFAFPYPTKNVDHEDILKEKNKKKKSKKWREWKKDLDNWNRNWPRRFVVADEHWQDAVADWLD